MNKCVYNVLLGLAFVGMASGCLAMDKKLDEKKIEKEEFCGKTFEPSKHKLRFAVGGSDGKIELYCADFEKKNSLRDIWCEKIGELDGHAGEIKALSFSPNGNLLASCSKEKKGLKFKVWDMKTGECVKAFTQSYKDEIKLLSFAGRDDYVVSNDYNQYTYRTELRFDRLKKELLGGQIRESFSGTTLAFAPQKDSVDHQTG